MVRNGKEQLNEDQSKPVVDGTPFGGAEFFSQEAIYGDEDTSDMPDEVRQFFDSHDFSEVPFKVMLKQIPEGGSSADESYVKGWKNQVPSLDYIANEWGPGSYVIIFNWRGKDPETGRARNMGERVYISISDKYQEQYEDYQEKRRIEKAVKRKKELERIKHAREVDEAISGQSENTALSQADPLQAGQQYIEKMSRAADMLGWKRGFDWEGLMKMLIPALPAALGYLTNKQQQTVERQDRMMTLMLTTMQNNTQQLVEAMRNQNGPQSGSDMMKEMFSMVTGAMDIKSALNGENNKESIVDKICKLVEGVAPMIVQMAAMPRQQREAMPAYQAAKAYVDTDPTFQAARNDPDVLHMLVERWDGFYGWEQTDSILEVGGLARPETCPRTPDKRYKAGDPRNESQGAPPATREDFEEQAGDIEVEDE